jgi:predicted CopG family antitoxin
MRKEEEVEMKDERRGMSDLVPPYSCRKRRDGDNATVKSDEIVLQCPQNGLSLHRK